MVSSSLRTPRPALTYSILGLFLVIGATVLTISVCALQPTHQLALLDFDVVPDMGYIGWLSKHPQMLSRRTGEPLQCFIATKPVIPSASMFPSRGGYTGHQPTRHSKWECNSCCSCSQAIHAPGPVHTGGARQSHAIARASSGRVQGTMATQAARQPSGTSAMRMEALDLQEIQARMPSPGNTEEPFAATSPLS